ILPATGRFIASMARIAAVSSIRLLVVSRSPPQSSFSCGPMRRMAPQPPGPGLPLQAPSVKISIVSVAMVFFLSHRSQRLGAHRFFAPVGGNQPHARRALDGLQNVDAPGDVPPALAGLSVHWSALQPVEAFKGGEVTTQLGVARFKAKELEPVLEAVGRQEAAVPREIAAPVELPFDPPQRIGVEADDDDLPLRDQDAFHLAQDLVRLLAEFQRMRQDSKVDARGSK